MMPSIMSGSLIRETPPWARMSAGTRSSAITATAPASSAILACSAVTTSMITPPLSISAMPRLTRVVPVPECLRGSAQPCLNRTAASGRGPTRGRPGRRSAIAASAWRRTTQIAEDDREVLAAASTHSASSSRIGRSRSPLRPVITRMAPAGRHARRCRPWRRSRATRPRPGVGRQAAHQQAEQGQAEVEVAVPRAGEVERQPAEDRAVADAVERGVRGTPRRATSGPTCAPSRRRSGR